MSGPPSWERPAGSVVLRTLVGAVAAQPDRVFAVLAARLDPGDRSGFLVDALGRRAVVQGDYWYRAEYSVEPDGTGSRVTCEIVNVASGPKVFGALTGRSVLRAAPRAFGDLLDEIGRQFAP